MQEIEKQISALPKINSEAMRLYYQKYLYNFDQLLKRVKVSGDLDIDEEIARVHEKSNIFLDAGNF